MICILDALLNKITYAILLIGYFGISLLRVNFSFTLTLKNILYIRREASVLLSTTTNFDEEYTHYHMYTNCQMFCLKRKYF